MTRSAGEIGAGLAPAREPRAIPPGERIHVLGIAGAGASAAGLLAAWAGAIVSGCDAGGSSPYSVALEAAGITVATGHDPAHLSEPGRPDRLAVTKALTAIEPNHPELAAARSAGIPIESVQQVIADAAVGRRLVGVAGTHGKSTTAGWLVHVLVQAGAEPTAFVGALLPSALTGALPATARQGRGADFVVEADEYAGNFDPYRPSVAILTSAEWDHPDVFADEAAVLDTFEKWVRGLVGAGDPPTLVANIADPGVARLVGRLGNWPGLLLTTRVESGEPISSGLGSALPRMGTALGPARELVGRIEALEPGGTVLGIQGLSESGPLTTHLRTAGRHNASNALGVAGAALTLGIAPEVIVEHLGTFGGVGRRLERKGESAGVAVYDDYGHHPTAIRETIAAVRQREPGRRVWAAYEPLTFHRTAAMLDAFAAALAGADAVVIADIWAGRDPDTSIASADGLAAAVARLRPEIPAAAPGSVEATADWLAAHAETGDAVLVMGGGRSYRIAELLLEKLAAR